jgi:hypothetical protein
MNVLLIYSTFEVAVRPPPSHRAALQIAPHYVLFRHIILEPHLLHSILLEPHLLHSFLLIDMANTNGTNPYSGSLGEPCRSGRNWKHAHETGGARKPRKKAVPKGQCKDPPELLTYLNAQAQLLCKDHESLGSNSAAALEHHQATVGNPPTHLNAQAQLQCKDQKSLSENPPQAGMPTLIPLAQVDMTSASDRCYPIRPNCSALNTPPKKILVRSKDNDVTDISPRRP